MTLLLFMGLPSAWAEDLSVSSNVRGAHIAINGEETGFRTPAVISGLSPGEVVVEVYDQCRRGSSRVNVASGTANRVSIDAEEALAQLTVEVTPAQAVVDVNDGQVKMSPNVPVGLPCGTYEVKAELKGYSSASYTLELSGGQELTLPIELDRLGKSTVEISVKPSAGVIFFDGKEVGADAVSMPSVFEGEHVLAAELKGYNSVEALIVVGDGDDLVLSIELGRGDKDSEVSGLGGAGRAALAEGAKRKMAASPTTPAPTSASKKAVPVDESLPEEEEESAEPPKKVVSGKSLPEDDGADEPEELGEDPEELADDEDNLDEVPDEVAPTKSWSEMHKEEPPARTAEKSTSKKSTATKSAGGSSKTGLKVAGGTMLGVGAVVAGGGGYYTYAQAASAYEIYGGMQTAADSANGPEGDRLQKKAETYYYDEFVPQATLMYGAFGVGGALAATGLVLLLVDADLPVVLPTPNGGAMVGWSRSF